MNKHSNELPAVLSQLQSVETLHLRVGQPVVMPSRSPIDGKFDLLTVMLETWKH